MILLLLVFMFLQSFPANGSPIQNLFGGERQRSSSSFKCPKRSRKKIAANNQEKSLQNGASRPASLTSKNYIRDKKYHSLNDFLQDPAFSLYQSTVTQIQNPMRLKSLQNLQLPERMNLLHSCVPTTSQSKRILRLNYHIIISVIQNQRYLFYFR